MPRLTKRLIDATTYPAAGQVFIRDEELSGFALRVTPGSKSFILEKRIHGRGRRYTIGPYGPLTVEQARKQAQELIADISRGLDPTGIRQAQRDEFTFGQLKDLYLERHGIRKRSVRNDESMLDNHLAPWHSRKLSAIARADLVKLHVKIGENAPYAANRVVALVRRMFNLARTWGVFGGDNPAAGIELFKEEKRDRFVKPEELPELFKAIQKEPNPYRAAAFLILLLTGARKTEVLCMRWEDLDLKQATWRIPETKAGRPHLLPLPRAAVKLLAHLPRQEGSPYVFPGRRQGQHLVKLSKAWKTIRQEAKLEDVRIHDLRRTLGSWLAASGASLPLIGKALNHSQVSTTAVYARLDLEPVRVALEANAKKMLAVANGQPAARSKDSQRGK